MVQRNWTPHPEVLPSLLCASWFSGCKCMFPQKETSFVQLFFNPAWFWKQWTLCMILWKSGVITLIASGKSLKLAAVSAAKSFSRFTYEYWETRNSISKKSVIMWVILGPGLCVIWLCRINSTISLDLTTKGFPSRSACQTLWRFLHKKSNR